MMDKRIGNKSKRGKPQILTLGRYRQKITVNPIMVSPSVQHCDTPLNAIPYRPNPMATMTHVTVMGEINLSTDEKTPV